MLSAPGIVVSTLFVLPLALVLHARGRSAGGPGAFAWPTAVLLYPLALRVLNELALGFDPAPVLDVFAWVFYGVLHFASPFLVGWWLWFFGPPSAANVYGWCLGLQNITGLALHILNPHAAPWYYDTYPPGTVPDYSFPGNAAGLVRVDKILGTHLYVDGFRKGPVVFGAIPSLHAATAVCSSLFIARYCARAGTVAMALYTAFMFHATMYFHHHWAIDLAAGSALAVLFFAAAALGPLRRIEHDHCRLLSTRGIDRLLARAAPPPSSVSLWHAPHAHAAAAATARPPLFPLPSCLARARAHHHLHLGSPTRSTAAAAAWQALPTEIPLSDVEARAAAPVPVPAAAAAATAAAVFALGYSPSPPLGPRSSSSASASASASSSPALGLGLGLDDAKLLLPPLLAPLPPAAEPVSVLSPAPPAGPRPDTDCGARCSSDSSRSSGRTLV